MGRFIKINSCLAFLLMAVAFAGCSRDESPIPPADLPTAAGFHLGERVALLRDLSPSDVIVWLNREPITKADYLRRVSMAERLYRLDKKLPLQGDDKSVGKQFKRNNAYYISELIGEGLIRQAARVQGVVPVEKDVKVIRKNIAKSILKGKYKFDQIIEKLPADDAAALCEKVNLQAQAQALMRLAATNAIERVEEAEVDSALEQIAAFNQRAKRENEKSRKRALRAKAEIESGASFAEVAKREAQIHPEYGEKWEDLQLGEFESDEPIRQWLEKADVGALSDPIDLDDGLAILGLVAKTPLEIPGREESEPVIYSYTVVRCTFRAFEEAPERTRAQIRDEILADRRKAAGESLMKKLRAEAVIYMPYGDDLFPVKKPKPTGARPLPQALKDVMTEEEQEKANEAH